VLLLPIAYGVSPSHMVSDVPTKPVLSTIARDGSGEFTEKRSRFLCTLRRVSTMDAAQAVIAEVRQRDWDGRHHCTAVVLGVQGETVRSNDDGEPAGTAGAPMLAALQGAGVSDVVAVVTRWFGGVLLGTGGLVRAYSKAVQLAVENVGTVQRREMQRATLAVTAAEAGRIENALRQWIGQHGGVLSGVQYGAQADFQLLVPPEEIDALERWRTQLGLTELSYQDTAITEVRK